MRWLAAVAMVLAVGCTPDSANDCDEAGEALSAAFDRLEEDPSAENLAASQDANAEFRRLGCDQQE